MKSKNPMESQETINALMQKDLTIIKEAVKDISEKMDDNYVTKADFWPVKTIVYGGTGLALAAIASAIIYTVLK